MKHLSYLFLILFFIDFIVDTVIAPGEIESLRYISKGSLMLLLLAFFITEASAFTTKDNSAYIKLMCGALIFSFLGDIFLVKDGSLNFMLGLASFLIAHIFYILLFYRISPFNDKSSLLFWVSGIVILSYIVILNYLFHLQATAQGLLLPVMLYSFILGAMLFTAVNVNNAVMRPKPFAFYIAAGAVSFVASDSMLAFNKFYLTTPLSGSYIMLTYCLAQFFIVTGVVKFIKQRS
jgi:uncharacterized membrane protein YhhN